jgi:branched-chain amino acid transport system ATP-binding protein
MGISLVPEGRGLFPGMSVLENLEMGAYLEKDSRIIRERMEAVFQLFPILENRLKQRGSTLSGGEQQMLVMGRAMMAHPKLMLLDEPSLGLAPLLVDEIYEIIARVNAEEKTSVLVVEQNARAALSISEYSYVMENGRVVLDGPSSKLADNEDIKEFYLGLSKLGEKKSFQ